MTRTAPRLTGLDAARGLAVLGMIAAHLGPPHADLDLGDPSTWLSLVDGRSAVLFALCAGISLTLMTRPRGDEPVVVARRRVLVRAVALFVLGCLLTALGTPVLVILPTYAVAFVASLPLLRARSRTVAVTAAAALLVGPVVMVLGWAVPGGVHDPLVGGVVLGPYPAVTWWGIVLVGMLVGRLDLGRLGVQGWLVGGGLLAAVTGYGGGLLLRAALGLPASENGGGSSDDASGPGSSSAPGGSSSAPVPTGGPETSGTPGTSGGSGGPDLTPQGGSAPADAPLVAPVGGGTLEHPGVHWAGLTGVDPHAGSTVEVLGALGVALVVLGLCLLLARRAARVLTPLRAVGALALTLYAAHIVVYAVLTAGGWVPDEDPAHAIAWLPFAATAVGAVVVAVPWRRFVGSGPLEAVVRRLSRTLDDPGPRSRPR